MHKPLPDIRRRVFAAHPRKKQTYQVDFRGRSEFEHETETNKYNFRHDNRMQHGTLAVHISKRCCSKSGTVNMSIVSL
jgi:hypothetical protein